MPLPIRAAGMLLEIISRTDRRLHLNKTTSLTAEERELVSTNMFSFTLRAWRGIILPLSLSEQDRAELQAVLRSEGYDGSVSSRAQIVLWYDEGRRKGEIAAMSGASRPTVDKWLARYEKFGMDGLVSRTSPGGPQSDPGPDPREGSRVDQDDTSGGVGDIALVVDGDGPLHQEDRGRVRVADLGVAAVAGHASGEGAG